MGNPDRQLRPSLLLSRAADIEVARCSCDNMVTVATGQLSPVATVNCGHVTIVPLHSNE
jgi:hypothetical protein